MRETFTLITNLTYVTIGDVRTMTHALLLETGEGLSRGSVQCKIRGFGTDSAWPVFDYFLRGTSIEYTLADAQSRAIFITDSGSRPLSSGAIMTIAGGPTLQLIVSGHGASTKDVVANRLIDEFEGDSGQRTILSVWERLLQRVHEFWTAPNMPRLAWVRR